jgi:hypothetical protein
MTSRPDIGQAAPAHSQDRRRARSGKARTGTVAPLHRGMTGPARRPTSRVWFTVRCLVPSARSYRGPRFAPWSRDRHAACRHFPAWLPDWLPRGHAAEGSLVRGGPGTDLLRGTQKVTSNSEEPP